MLLEVPGDFDLQMSQPHVELAVRNTFGWEPDQYTWEQQSVSQDSLWILVYPKGCV